MSDLRQLTGSQPAHLDLDRYLARIGLDRAPTVDADGLRELHRAQLFTIPFENLDVLLGRPLRFDAASLQSKLVERERGGYCFELNGLLQLALEGFGFRSRPLLGRVHLHAEPTGRTHQLCLVELGDRRWVTDVGFGGGGPRAPLPLEAGTMEVDGVSVRLEETEQWGWMLQTLDQGEWKNSYSFDLTWVTPGDIVVGNHYTATSPDSPFTNNRFISRPTGDGRVSFLDLEKTVISGSTVTRTTLPDDDTYLERLESEFGIRLDATYPALGGSRHG